MSWFTEYYEEESYYGDYSDDWLKEVEETYIISKVTKAQNAYNYKIGLVNKEDILDTDVIIVSEDVFNPDIYKVGKEVKITKKVIA